MNFKRLKEKLSWPQKISDSTETIIAELNSLLAEEFQAWYQYYIVAPFLVGNERASIQEFFNETAKDELDDHATKLINRINELNAPCVLATPESWKEMAVSKFMTGDYDVINQLNLNRQAEIDAIAHYQRVIEIAETIKDYTTRDILKEILADEEQHLSELNDFLKDLGQTLPT